MDQGTAALIVGRALEGARAFQELIPTLKAHCAPDEYEALVRGVALVVAEIGQRIVNPILAGHPDLEAALEAEVDRQRGG